MTALDSLMTKSMFASPMSVVTIETSVLESPTTPVVMRRLNRYEYSNAVRDLLELKGDIYPLPEKTIRGNQPYFEPASGRLIGRHARRGTTCRSASSMR